MTSGFSGALQLTDLNDFITPSQECIKPVTLQKKSIKGGSVVLSDTGDIFEINEDGTKEKLQKAKITLNDCLACSGCITSAESVLISEQSQEEFFKVVEENKRHEKANDHDKVKILVISISPQSRAALGVRYGLDAEQTAKRLTAFFHSLGIKYVLDTTVSREFSLIESQREFIHRYKSNDSHTRMLPMLSSACPGWICYAEKTHGEYILPHLSSVKSPQQIMGSIVKNYLAEKLQKRPDQMYHATVMPCFDKKLEASRKDFYNNEHQTRDVDCVLTSIEVEAMLQNKGISLNEIPPEELDDLSLQALFHSELYTHKGSSSGGYSDHIFKYAAHTLFGETLSNLEYKVLRNKDFKEVLLEKDGRELLRFAIANGFRNIQNIVQKMKRGKCPYHFVEIMACPSGCINGGAQVRAVYESPQELLLKVEEHYHSLPARNPEESTIMKQLYEDWLGGVDSPKAKQMLHTEYHAVEKINNALLIKW